MDMKTRVRDRLAQEDILAQRHLGGRLYGAIKWSA